jgi:hypothetical protein
MLTENSRMEKDQGGLQPNIPVPTTDDRAGKEQSKESNSVVLTPTPTGRWVQLDNTDLMGFDISPKPIIVKTAEDCRLSCDRESKCTAYTFNQNYRACFLKWGASQALQYTGAFSAYKGSNIVQRIGKEYGPEIGFRGQNGACECPALRAAKACVETKRFEPDQGFAWDYPGGSQNLVSHPVCAGSLRLATSAIKRVSPHRQSRTGNASGREAQMREGAPLNGTPHGAV